MQAHNKVCEEGVVKCEGCGEKMKRKEVRDVSAAGLPRGWGWATLQPGVGLVFGTKCSLDFQAYHYRPCIYCTPVVSGIVKLLVKLSVNFQFKMSSCMD